MGVALESTRSSSPTMRRASLPLLERAKLMDLPLFSLDFRGSAIPQHNPTLEYNFNVLKVLFTRNLLSKPLYSQYLFVIYLLL